MKAKGNVQKKFQKKTHVEHILLRPDTYIGSIENCEETLFVYCKDAQGIVEKKMQMNWGLYKIFDEILVNAADNSQRRAKMSFINVQVKTSSGEIMIENDGEAIPIVFHKKQKVYIPEMIFGMLLSGSNFDDSVRKTVGGRNGYGCKLANIYSKSFEVLLLNERRGKKYVQRWTDNMSLKSAPEISDWAPDSGDSLKTRSTKDVTLAEFSSSGRRRRQSSKPEKGSKARGLAKNLVRITFKPDVQRFGMKRISPDLCALMHKRVIDIKAFVGRDVKVTFNRKTVKCPGFECFVKMHLRSNQRGGLVKFRKIRNGFDLGVGISSEGFRQVSLVNGINTLKGGTHVKYVLNQLTEGLVKHVAKQHKLASLKPYMVKNNLFLFINCLVENPAFGSQTKEALKTKKDSLDNLKVPDSFVKDLLKFSPLIECIVNESRMRESNSLTRAMNVKPRNKRDLLKIIKLEDANWAGTRRAQECTLILTEGDSAKSLAMAGLDVVGRDAWGVFPLRGKLINVRNAKTKQIKENKEIKHIMQIMGLVMGKDYSKSRQRNELRYGRLMIMADQDVDGSHIKGLIINFVMFYWPELMKQRDFISQFVTPLIKVDLYARASALQNHAKSIRMGVLNRKAKKLVFFALSDFKGWYESLESPSDVKSIKYYKGLGTSTDREAREYFKNIHGHVKKFFYSGSDCKEAVEMAFSENQITNRKIWLSSGRAHQSSGLVHASQMSYKTFVDEEMMDYSIANLARSIPSVLDGLKPSKRKILFSCFKRNLTAEIKVAQLSGYVAEHSAYHHGEMSLNLTIVNMAQNFVGSNNVNLLEPLGQFGSRYSSGKEAASPRYIFTRLAGLARLLFRSDDDPLLTRLEEEGQMIEPVTYLPVVPMVLLNGAEGIGTGWSTCVPKYDLLDIIDNIRRRLRGAHFRWMKPHYRHFLGKITPMEGEKKCENAEQFGACGFGFDVLKFVCSGILKQSGKHELDVLELPVGVWTRNYKKFLNTLIEKQDSSVLLENFQEFHTRTTVHFKLFFDSSISIDLSKKRGFWMKKLRLSTSILLSNLVLFNSEGKLTHYKNILEIFDEYFHMRLSLYKRRRIHLLKKTLRDYRLFATKIAFLGVILSKKIDIGSLKQADLIESIRALRILQTWKSGGGDQQKLLDEVLRLEEVTKDVEENPMSDKEIEEKLLGMKISQLTADQRETLKKKLRGAGEKLEQVFQASPESMWRSDLRELEESYIEARRKECLELDRDLKKKGSEWTGKYLRHFEKKLGAISKGAKLLHKRGDALSKPERKASSESIQIIEVSSVSKQQPKVLRVPLENPGINQNHNANNLKRVKKQSQRKKPKEKRSSLAKKVKAKPNEKPRKSKPKSCLVSIEATRSRKMVIMSESDSDSD